MEIGFLPIGGPGRTGQTHSDGSALARLSLKTHVAAQQRGPFAHAEQTEGLGVLNLAVGNAAPVIPHFQDIVARRFRQTHLHCRGAAVADDVRQRLLKDPEKGGVQVLIPNRASDGRGDAAGDAGLFFKFMRLPFQRRQQASAVQHAGPQLGGNPPHRLDGFIHPAGD